VRKHFEQTGELPTPQPGDTVNDFLEVDANGDPIPTPCLRCLVKAYLYLVYRNIGDDQLAQKVYVEFYHPVGRPGAYGLFIFL
jgi:hypothetical protein